MSISRRRFLSLGAAATSLLIGACGNREERSTHKNQLRIYSWPDYLHPEAIPEFCKRHNAEVIYDAVSSNEGLLAKFQAGASDYDIVVPSSYALGKLIELNLLAELDHEKLPNFKNIYPRFRTSAVDPDCKHSIPYTFGTTGIAYNSEAFRAPFHSPDDWDIFWDERLSHRITLLEDPRETFGMALKHNGFSINTHNPGELDIAFQSLKKQKPQTMCYTSDQVIVYLATGDALVSLAYSGDAKQASRSNNNVAYVIPKSGASMWTDNVCIPRSAPNPDLAYAWINYILEPQVSAAITNYTFYATANETARKFVKPELLNDPGMYPSDAILDSCEEMKDVGDAIFMYDRLWTELKCI